MVKHLTASEMATRKWELMDQKQQAAHIQKLKRATKKRWSNMTEAERATQMRKVRRGKKRPK